MSRPTISEVNAFLADLQTFRETGAGPAEYAALMERKAELLQRIAAHTSGDADAAEVARLARERADALKSAH
ncbi:hypothetical protein [Streptomyces sp. L2]|uniref:hypothetical protein n=1 Tax=Streptomyces sp. L2 TaxID=2162665 RepID=UPI001011E9BD|nr:hypothetical protein [Streptomyces sp. L2]